MLFGFLLLLTNAHKEVWLVVMIGLNCKIHAICTRKPSITISLNAEFIYSQPSMSVQDLFPKCVNAQMQLDLHLTSSQCFCFIQ